MNSRLKDELSLIPIGHMLVVSKELREAGKVRAEQLLDAYDERVAIICEGRKPTPEDFLAAWENTLHIKFSDFDRVAKKRGEA